MATAQQLEQAPVDNEHSLDAPPGKEFNGEHDMNFGAVAPLKDDGFGVPTPSQSCGWSFDMYRD